MVDESFFELKNYNGFKISTNHHKSAASNQKLNNTWYPEQNNLTTVWRTYLGSQVVYQRTLLKLDMEILQDNLYLKQISMLVGYGDCFLLLSAHEKRISP